MRFAAIISSFVKVPKIKKELGLDAFYGKVVRSLKSLLLIREDAQPIGVIIHSL
jgi:hypothetical protein